MLKIEIHSLRQFCEHINMNQEQIPIETLREQGFEIATIAELDFYRNLHPASLLYSCLYESYRELIAPFMPFSRAQLAQDLFAVAASKTTDPRFFVEFGATDGVSLSNTWLLEKKLGWSGILAEPAKIWHNALIQNRDCIIDTRCVAKQSGQMCSFLEVKSSNKASPELSGIKQFANNGDWASAIRTEESTEYLVETVSLGDLLDSHSAPAEIQFMSIDTEGSELEILKNFDLKKRKIHSICVEHNFVANSRKQINNLLRDNGYSQILGNISKWDDWYVLKDY